MLHLQTHVLPKRQFQYKICGMKSIQKLVSFIVKNLPENRINRQVSSSYGRKAVPLEMVLCGRKSHETSIQKNGKTENCSCIPSEDRIVIGCSDARKIQTWTRCFVLFSNMYSCFLLQFVQWTYTENKRSHYSNEEKKVDESICLYSNYQKKSVLMTSTSIVGIQWIQWDWLTDMRLVLSSLIGAR